MTAARRAVPRLSQFVIEHLLLLPLGALVALVWVNVEPETYFRFTLCHRVRRERHGDGVLLRADHEGDRRGDDPGRRAASVAPHVMPVIASIGAAAVPALLHMRLAALDEPMLGIGWPVSLAVDLA